MKNIPILILLASFFAGCFEINEESKQYTIHIFSATSPVDQVEVLGFRPYLYMDGNTLVILDKQFIPTLDLPLHIVSDDRSALTQFPVISINPGERIQLNQQVPLDPGLFNWSMGSVEEIATYTVGKVVDVEILSIEDGMVRIRCVATNTNVAGWVEYDQAVEDPVFKPIFSVNKLDSTEEGWELPMNEWLIVLGLFRSNPETDDLFQSYFGVMVVDQKAEESNY